MLLLGGTFDPIHFGHLHPAMELAETMQAERIVILPNHIPPHREMPGSNAQHRLAMCQLAAKTDPVFTVDDREIRKASASYTIETLIELKQAVGERPLCFVMGMDSLISLDKWHRFDELFEHCHFIVNPRPGYKPRFNNKIQQVLNQRLVTDPKALQDNEAGHIYLTENIKLMISATYLRDRLKLNKNCRCLLPADVYDYINLHNLYSA